MVELYFDAKLTTLRTGHEARLTLQRIGRVYGWNERPVASITADDAAAMLLAAKAGELGWSDDRIIVIDEDLGLSGSGSVARAGFARLTAEVALARVGLVLGLEVSRLVRNNADWHRLIDLAGLTDTLIGDPDGIYHPALFNDHLLLGLKRTVT